LIARTDGLVSALWNPAWSLEKIIGRLAGFEANELGRF
jgi:hypothetical protein